MNLQTRDAVRVQLRRSATAVAAARVAIGVTALVWPGLPSRSWVGAGPGAGSGTGSAGLAARVFGRALGGRDLGLGLGGLVALAQLGAVPGPLGQAGVPGEPGPAGGTEAAAAAESASVWVAAGALSDALDVVTTLVAWRELPRFSRWLVLSSAAGAALTGAAGAVALRPDARRA